MTSRFQPHLVLPLGTNVLTRGDGGVGVVVEAPAAGAEGELECAVVLVFADDGTV